MVALAARDQPLPILLTCKYLLSLVLGLGLLLTLVQSEFELQACLRALRIYSLVVVVLQVALQFVVPEASALHPGGGGSGEGHITAGFGKGKARNKAGKVGRCDTELSRQWEVSGVVGNYKLEVEVLVRISRKSHDEFCVKEDREN